MSKPLVAIVGRPNVGKSTIINGLAQKRVSIVEDLPGVTRDRIYCDAQWLDREFTLIDTGGIEFREEADQISDGIRMQAQLAIEEADVILFVTDVRVGLLDDDVTIAEILRKTGKPVVVAVNKVDTEAQEMDVYEFYALGLGDPIGISASNRVGFGDLLDKISEGFPKYEARESEDIIRTAIVGRPNVGKSTLVNSLLGYERSLVADEMGTTRDAIDSLWTHKGKKFVLVDTAGMRKKNKIDEPLEKYSVIRSIRAIDDCDVAVFVLDAKDMLTEQDKKIIGYIHEAGKGLILMVNKWDIVEKDTHTSVDFEKKIRNGLPFAPYVRILFGSGLTKQRIHKLGDLIYSVAEQQSMRISTSVLNDLLEDAKIINPPPAHAGKLAKIYYMTQVGIRPPTFVMFVNDVNLIHFSYVRYIENRLRESFSFSGTPIRIVVRSKRDGEEVC
ncbi:ribosome biogenesis GTPase Der [Dialister micraerophilus]|uniref:GTPase Der n=1 Tax=Dialister micraerophilus DSM 19965 TaxID=888062 RepID=F2BW11_9FIRM|nr:ribosome biogenesis GTPase Der [Dialister micraerophilus]EGF15687.1 ribosome-associated GTPase EngA [Dialister micraerophilus DSM 19965]MDK8285103.1 ribosome biogenesis GTPase Der [Dialister micraerophilus]MDU5301125.1 ribosome biogenesis GTPase Der [Dialister micraerophilus]